ncbi:OprD family outer membrane porin [Entomomonas asaccharolytica]|uniref:OprD family outer membrane porin n=1 Tax=Entomomonas asaccharolytica TaxID=2785331 RepID=A0A974NEE5_9GAMM|nr:OprD family outer membrane porin [Entomomonas asaccharolytica]QQP84954.1 OprD family outer membrane porin [Entomomonas asaccharolytica]
MQLRNRGVLVAIGIIGLSNWSIADDIVSQQTSKGFIDDSRLEVISRTMYMSSNARKGGFYSLGGYAKSDKDHGQAEDFGTALIGIYQSGFTEGTVGFGIDVMTMTAYKLDGGRGRSSDDVNNLFPADGRSGRPQDNISKLAPALKLRISKTELKYGQMMVDTPVFATQPIEDKLLPEDATGFLLRSQEIDNLVINAGYFTALRGQEYSHQDSIRQDSAFFDNGKTLKRVYFAGAEYQFNDSFSGKLYASKNKDFWKKYYANLNYNYEFNEDSDIDLDFNWYKTKSVGKGYADELRANGDNRRINSDLWSIAAAYSYQAHTFTVAYQRNSGTGGLGRTSFPYDIEGGAAIAVANSMQYSDFNFENQRSWQVRYDLDFADYGVPGLTFVAAYVKGSKATAENKDYRRKGKSWERNIQLGYTIQEGKAKELSFVLQHAQYRSNFGGGTDYSVNGKHNAYGRDNLDELRLIVQYPLSIL